MLAATCIAPRCADPRQPGSLFCGTHERATPAQRGGWISAERRRRQMNASKETAMDASNIVRRLWIGGVPPFDRPLPDFDVLVLCAQELQPRQVGFQGQTIRIPLPDAALDNPDLRRALIGGRQVAEALAQGRRVLVTCAQGRNRSALVAGLAMGLRYRMTADQVVTMIRARRRPDCLTNTHFVGYLERFIGRGHPVHQRHIKPPAL